MGKPYGNFIYEIGEVIQGDGRNIEIIDREYRSRSVKRRNKPNYTQNRKYYKYKCLKCGLENWILEYYLHNENRGCKRCDVPFVTELIVGVNDIATADPSMVKYLKNKDDAYKYTPSSSEEIDVICEYCGREYRKSVVAVHISGVSCSCGDGWSYPNKFMYSVLEQSGVDFIPEKNFTWSDNKVYDDYIEYNNLKIITEQHGKQHYVSSINMNGKFRTSDEERANDEYKRKLAMSNGIDYYFEIDCQKSDRDYIKSNIISSGLLKVLNLSEEEIDWDKCNEFATSNMIKEFCVFYNEHEGMTAAKMAELFHIGKHTMQSYLRRGSNLGWCNYYGMENKLRAISKTNLKRSKPVYCSEINMYFSNANVASKYFEDNDKFMHHRNIRMSANSGKPYNGYHFQFITQDQFNKAKSESSDNTVGDYFLYN